MYMYAIKFDWKSIKHVLKVMCHNGPKVLDRWVLANSEDLIQNVPRLSDNGLHGHSNVAPF